MLLDDLPLNVEGARAVGMPAVKFVDTRHVIADLEAQVAGSRALNRETGTKPTSDAARPGDEG